MTHVRPTDSSWFRAIETRYQHPRPANMQAGPKITERYRKLIQCGMLIATANSPRTNTAIHRIGVDRFASSRGPRRATYSPTRPNIAWPGLTIQNARRTMYRGPDAYSSTYGFIAL